MGEVEVDFGVEKIAGEVDVDLGVGGGGSFWEKKRCTWEKWMYCGEKWR